VGVTSLKKTVTFFGMLLSMLLMCPTDVWAAGSGETTTQVPVWLCIPFAGLLLCPEALLLDELPCDDWDARFAPENILTEKGILR